jgi:SAM-dependent methyltransferase
VPKFDAPIAAQSSPADRAWLERARAAWDARAERWDSRAEANASAPDRVADLERIWGALALRPGARLLDAGCGSGQYALAFAARGAVVTGVDLSPRMIQRAREHAAEREISVSWRVGDLSSLPEPSGAFDAVLARMVLPFVPNLVAVLRELRRVLSADGYLLASVPGALSPIYRDSWQRYLPEHEPDATYLLPWELERLLHEEGWRIADGWGEWGEDRHGVANRLSGPSSAEREVQKATATTWTTIAARAAGA